jgi:regulator of sirC expression with transglutaminase-like and TPR domain
MDEPTRRFAELVARPEGDVPLDEAALLIAAHAEPDLDVKHEVARLDELAADCPVPTFEGVIRHLFDDLGFRGNTEDYANPANSYLHEVLTRRLGIPISLSVVTMEVGRRLGVPLAGVGMPGHFLVRHLGEPPVFLDPFGGGRRLDESGCEAIFRRLGGTGPWSAHYVDPVGTLAILNRMLVNLQGTFLPRDLRSAAWVLGLRLAIPGLVPGERRDLARALGSLGQFESAAAELDRLADALPTAEAAELRAEALALRARTN